MKKKYRMLRKGEYIRPTDEVLCAQAIDPKWEKMSSLEIRIDMSDERVGGTWKPGEARRRVKK